MASKTKLTHLGFICDGNRRWAQERNLPTLEGYRKGAESADTIINELLGSEVDFVSFFIFSTENWGRSPEEVAYLMKLLSNKIDDMAKKAQQNNVRILVMGRPDLVDPKLWARVQKAETSTKDNTGLTVCLCFNYGGQWEIVDAARKACETGETEWTPESFQKYLYHPEVPDCDMIVRTSNEQRISGFQLWRAAYAELLFLDKYFPALEKEDVKYILEEFHRRHRRFGK